MSPAKPQAPAGIAVTLALLGLLLLPAHPAQAAAPQWSGSVKSLNLYGEEAPADLFPSYRLSSNRVRLNVDWQPASGWLLQTSLDHQLLWSDPGEFFPLAGDGRNRRLDLDKSWQHSEQSASRLQVDRLSLQWRRGAVDTTLGRQPIGFGRILIFSPLDVVAPFAPDAIDTDVRSGVDALRSSFNYGLDGELGALAVWGADGHRDSLLATWSDNRAGIDLLMIGGRLRGRSMLGAGLAGSLGTLGLKGEASFHRGRDTHESGGDLYDSYSLAAVEGWYRFANGISLVVQYLYNGPGVDDPADYPRALVSAPLQEGLTYLLGRHYLMAAPAYQIHPLATLQGMVICNLADHSALLRPTLDLNLADNLSLQLFWTWTRGERPRQAGMFAPVEARSEFGLRGDSGGLFLKWFY